VGLPPGEWLLVQWSIGCDRVIVNGATTFIDGDCTNAVPGRLLRHGTD
jgi:N-acyl-D-aspartate/D-glutamate deacylase